MGEWEKGRRGRGDPQQARVAEGVGKGGEEEKRRRGEEEKRRNVERRAGEGRGGRG
jgi:hypothetical protein